MAERRNKRLRRATPYWIRPQAFARMRSEIERAAEIHLVIASIYAELESPKHAKAETNESEGKEENAEGKEAQP